MSKFVATLASIGASYFLLLALKTGEVSKVNAIYQGMMVTGVIAGILLLQEKYSFLAYRSLLVLVLEFLVQ
mgnify:CR=1 FL=1